MGSVAWPSGVCWMVDNGRGEDMFVPYRTQPEWDTFVANRPAQTTVVPCCAQQTVQICGNQYILPLSRTGTTRTVTVPRELTPGQCYRASCRNQTTGAWMTLTGIAAANNVVYTRSPSNMGTWVVQYSYVSGGSAGLDVSYQCQQHSWVPQSGPVDCTQPIPPSAFNVATAINCFPDHENPPYDGWRTTGSNLCRVYAPMGGPHQYITGYPWSYSSNTFANGWGRTNLQCQQPMPC